MAEDIYLKDIQISERGFDQQVSDRTYVDLNTTGPGDLATVDGRENLLQACSTDF